MVKRYRAGIIGLGRIGFLFQYDKKREQPASHSLALFLNKSIKLVCGSDINQERLTKWQSFYKNSRTYLSYKEMLDKENLDIITIAVSEKDHLEVVLDAIKRKPKLIILEKPVASNSKDSYLIKKQSDEYNVPILINHPRRYSNDYIRLKKILEEKYIGEIHSVNISFCSGLKVWEKECEINGDCALIHDGTHVIDIINYLFNVDLSKPIIDKIVFSYNTKEEIDSIYFHYEFETIPYILYIEISGNKKFFGFDIDIKANLGRIVIGNGYFKIYKRERSKLYSNFYSLTKKFDYSKIKLKYFTNMINNAVNFLNDKEEILSSLNDGIRSLDNLYIILETIFK